MTIYYECPVCKKDRNADMTSVKILCRENGLSGESVNPGGRELSFGGVILQIHDQCNSCDIVKIQEFLKERNG